MAIPSPQRLAAIARQATTALGDRLQPRSRHLWEAMLLRRSEVSGGEPDYLHPLAQPIVLVPRWAAQAAAGVGATVDRGLVETAAAAGAIGYYAVRLQDDLVDEGIGDPAAVAVLSSAVLAAAQSTLGSMGPSVRFWEWHCDVLLRYAEAMQFEADIRSTPDVYDEDAFERVLDRSRPLVVPGVAVLDAAGAWPLHPDFEQMIMAATGALQIVNDLGHAVTDLAQGNRTWVHTLLGVSDGPLNRGRLIGGVDRVLDRMRDRLVKVADLAVALGLSEAAAWAGATERAAGDRFERLLISLLRRPAGA
jgi:hypothetical protein